MATTSADAKGALGPGAELGHYRIVRALGSGGMADVFEADDLRLGRRVALKVLPPEYCRNPQLIARFQKEVRAAAGLNHRNIVTVFEVGHDDPYHFFSMRLLTGGDLRKRIEGGLLPVDSLTILREVADAFAHAHARGFVHRDVKPENIMFDEQGFPILTDFGIAKALDANTHMTRTGVTLGTPRYLSPEQAKGKAVDARADLYSLGVILYEMLTGRPPYDAEESMAVIFKHVTEPVPTLPPHHARLQALLDKLMAKDPQQRVASAGELIRMIDALQPRTTTGEIRQSQLKTAENPLVTQLLTPSSSRSTGAPIGVAPPTTRPGAESKAPVKTAQSPLITTREQIERKRKELDDLERAEIARKRRELEELEKIETAERQTGTPTPERPETPVRRRLPSARAGLGLAAAAAVAVAVATWALLKPAAPPEQSAPQNGTVSSVPAPLPASKPAAAEAEQASAAQRAKEERERATAARQALAREKEQQRLQKEELARQQREAQLRSKQQSDQAEALRLQEQRDREQAELARRQKEEDAQRQKEKEAVREAELKRQEEAARKAELKRQEDAARKAELQRQEEAARKAEAEEAARQKQLAEKKKAEDAKKPAEASEKEQAEAKAKERARRPSGF